MVIIESKRLYPVSSTAAAAGGRVRVPHFVAVEVRGVVT